MSHVQVHAVASPQDQADFLRLPWQLYRNDPLWAPPLLSVQAELVGFRRHPFYDDARTRALVATCDGQICGRLAAIVNGAHQHLHGDHCGFFGFFECVNDSAVAQALFAAAQEWLRGEGCVVMRGPFSPSVNYESGLLVDGWDRPPAFLTSYNPPYYAALVEGSGLSKAWDLLAFEVERGMHSTMDPKIALVAEEALRRSGARLRQFNPRRFSHDARIFFDLYNRTLDNIPFFTPMSAREIEYAIHWLRTLTEPKYTAIAEVDGRAVAAVYGLPDYSPILRKLNGRMGPLGALRWWWNRRRFTKVRVFSINVLPEYQAWGLGLALFRNALTEGLAMGIESAELSWVLESSQLSHGTLARGGAMRTKTYRIYEAAL